MTGRAVAAFLVFLLLGACAPTIRAPGTARGPAALAPGFFTAVDGSRLPLRIWSPAAAPQAVLIALHGFNDYGNFFAAPGTWLAARGVQSYALDQRGFGAAPDRGIWAGTAAYGADLRALVSQVRLAHGDVPVFVLGESMGGAVILSTLADPLLIDGIILAAPAVWGRATMPWYQHMVLDLAAHTVPGLALTGRHLKITPSDNRDMLIALGRDPLVIKETRVDTVYGLVNLMDAALAAARAARGPMLILYGRHDEIIRRAAMDRFLNDIPNERSIKVAIYEKGFHMVLRDLQAKTVWADIAAWIDDPGHALPSGADKAGRAD